MTGTRLISLSILVFSLSAPGPHPPAAQVEAAPRLKGKVLRGGGSSPLVESLVVLHQISVDQSGAEIDSAWTDGEGSFTFRLPSVPRPGERSELYLASVRHQGVLYFGPVVAAAIQLDSPYVIQVYDTISAPAGGAPLPVSVRNVLLEDSDGGWRVTDLIEIRNDQDGTWVAPAGAPVWSHPLPGRAERFEFDGRGLPPDGVEFGEGSVKMTHPLSPGKHLLLIRYWIRDREFALPLRGRTEAFDLLVREPAPSLSIPELTAAQPIEIEGGETARHYSGRDLVDLEVHIKESQGARAVPMEWIAVVTALLLAMAGIIARRRSPVASREPRPPAAVDRGSLLLQIALLDEEFASGVDPNREVEREYRRARAALIEHLRSIG